MGKNSGQTTHVLPGDPPIEVALRQSDRARRFSLRVSRRDGQVSLSFPVWARTDAALAFLTEREDWLRAQVAAAPDAQRPRIGGHVPVLGEPRPVLPGTGRAARFDGAEIRVPDDARVGPRIQAMLKTLARDRLVEAVERHAATLGRPFGRITLRDTRSRWGSCSARGDLMFSWRLIMAPPAVLDYVAAHEVAHLAEMNHSARFWAVCETLCPEYRVHRGWLRQQGATLQAWHFDGTDPGGP